MKKRLLTVAALLLSLACAFALAGCFAGGSNKEGADADLKPLVVGSDNYPPYVYEDENGASTGIDVDILTEACRRIGYKPEFKAIDWEKKERLLSSGEVDCVMGCFTMTGRESQFRWAGPYMRSRQVVAVLPSSEIQSLEDLAGKTVAVQSTTKPEGIILDRTNEHVPEIQRMFSFSNRDYLGPALLKGYADAIAAHETSILQYEADYNVDFRILSDPLLEVGLGAAFDLNDSRGIDVQLNDAFAQMREDGTMEQIIGKYLSDPASYLETGALDE